MALLSCRGAHQTGPSARSAASSAMFWRGWRRSRRPHEGPAFLLAERLTGIAMTPRLLEEAAYLGGSVSLPR
ncbi:DUF6461 domain-containing protein [Bailinhaonella thermotolerans]